MFNFPFPPVLVLFCYDAHTLYTFGYLRNYAVNLTALVAVVDADNTHLQAIIDPLCARSERLFS